MLSIQTYQPERQMHKCNKTEFRESRSSAANRFLLLSDAPHANNSHLLKININNLLIRNDNRDMSHCPVRISARSSRISLVGREQTDH